MYGWFSFCIMSLSFNIGFIFCSRTSLSFLMIFIAYRRPVSFLRTRMTLLKAPLPTTLICSKSWRVTFILDSLFAVNVNLAKWARRNSPFSSTLKGLLYYVSQKSRASRISKVFSATINFFFSLTCWFITLILYSRVFRLMLCIIFKFWYVSCLLSYGVPSFFYFSCYFCHSSACYSSTL